LPAEEAADAVSEVFLVAWRRIEDLPSDESARLWLFGVTRNVVRNLDRSSRRRLRATARFAGLATAHASDPETQVVAASEHREVMTAYHRLSRADQEVLRLRLWEELSVADMATVLDCSDKAASKRYQRALGRLERATSKAPLPRMGPHLAPRGGEK
jgi:RNA polymerase sigma-70 factor (ECF subfamily)